MAKKENAFKSYFLIINERHITECRIKLRRLNLTENENGDYIVTVEQSKIINCKKKLRKNKVPFCFPSEFLHE